MSAIENFRNVLRRLRQADESALPKLIKSTGMSPDSIYGYLKGAEPPALPPPPPPGKPSPLDIAIYLFEQGADKDVPKDRIDVIKRALEADAHQLAVLRKQVDALFDDESINDADTSSSS